MNIDSIFAGLNPEILRLVAVCGVASWGVVEGIKPVIKTAVSNKWSNVIIRCSAILLGAGFGFAIDHGVFGAVCGAAGGALSSTSVASMRRLLARRAR